MGDFSYDAGEPELTEAEHDFMWLHQGSVFAAINEFLGEKEHTAVDEASAAAQQLRDAIIEKMPSRTERLLVMSKLLLLIEAERDNLVERILRSYTHWSHFEPRPDYENGGTYEWGGIGMQSHMIDSLASLAGLHPSTIRARQRKLSHKTLAEAQEMYANLPPRAVLEREN